MMEAYKQRMIIEYAELMDRIRKLRSMIYKWDEGKLDFEPACSKTMLFNQLEAMEQYANILEDRAKIEGVNLEDRNKEFFFDGFSEIVVETTDGEPVAVFNMHSNLPVVVTNGYHVRMRPKTNNGRK